MTNKQLMVIAFLVTMLVIAVSGGGLLIASAIEAQTQKCMLGDDR